MARFSSKERYFKFILYMVIIVLLNIVSVTLFFRADLTKDKIFSLSPASHEAVKTLSEPLSIKVFFSKNLPAPHNNTERYLKDLLNEYAAKAGRYFNYQFYNVSQDQTGLKTDSDENRSLAESYGIQPVQIRIMENDELKFKNAYMGMVIIHGDLIEKIPAITSTDGLEYKLTTAVKKLNSKVSALLRVTDKVRVRMYLSTSLNRVAPLMGLNQLPGLGQAVEEMIAKLNSKSLGVLEFTHIDLSKQEELNAAKKQYNIMALSWPNIPENNISAGNGAASLVIQHGTQTTTLPLISAVELPIIGTTYQMAEMNTLEEAVNTVVEKLIGINKDIGVLTGHGAHSMMPDRMAMMQGRPSQSMQVLNQLLSARYAVKQIDLKNASIPDGLNCLIIPRPTEKFSDYQLFQIDQALMKGTNIAFISDSFHEAGNNQGAMMGMPPQFEPIDTGLKKLLNHYGVDIQDAYVLDKNCYKHNAPQNMGGGEQKIYFAPMLKEETINNTPAFMDNIKGLVAMQISPVKLIEDNINTEKITTTRLFSSSNESWLMEGRININPMFITPPQDTDKFSSYDLAYLLEGTFTSYFKGKPVPEKEIEEKETSGNTPDNEQAGENPDTRPGDQGDSKVTVGGKEINKNQALSQLTAENTILETSKPVKLFVLPCSQMLQDNMLDPEGRTTNATFLLNVIDHLNGEGKIAALRSKQQTLNPITQTTGFTKNLFKTANIIGLPVLVIVFGLLVLAKRTSRRKKIAERFKA